MGVVVLAPVAQIDAAQVGHVALRASWVAEDGQLLVVRAPGADPHVQEALAAGGLDLLTELAVLVLVVAEAVQVGAPQQAPNEHSAGRCRGQDRRDFGARTGKPLVGVPAPVGEEQVIAGA